MPSPDRVAVVTGAGAGVGRATCAMLREDGYSVVGVDLVEPGDDGVTGDLTAQATWDAVREVVRRRDADGAACLVCAAADVVVAPLLETRPEEFRRLFDVNVVGVLRAMQALVPDMVRRGRGAVAVVCSVDSLYTEDGLSAYAASKAALLQVVRSAALEHSGDGLRVNAVCPGAIDTAFFRRALEATGDPEAALAQAVARIPSGEILRPEEVAAVLRFLVSEAASGLSGAAIAVDGGLTTTYDYRPA
jgi:NAD(P)-dependent dehydrogenase (short-subunit alcohol dehydrogenase family)